MKRLLSVVGAICVGFAAIWTVSVFLITQNATTPQAWAAGAAKVLPAARDYAKQLKSEGAPVPNQVSVNQLVAKGLVSKDDVKIFNGMDVSVSTSQDRRPDEVLIRARQTDGNEVVLLGDGSVHTEKQ
jgi:hypothetical protein